MCKCKLMPPPLLAHPTPSEAFCDSFVVYSYKMELTLWTIHKPMYIPPLTPAQAIRGQKSTVPQCARSWMRFASSVSRLGNFFCGRIRDSRKSLSKKTNG